MVSKITFISNLIQILIDYHYATAIKMLSFNLHYLLYNNFALAAKCTIHF